MTSPDRAGLQQMFETVRRRTETLTAPLSPEDCTIQSMPDVSPTKWHMAHTTWFFEAFLLEHFVPGYAWVDEAYNYLFNSYYEAVGPRHARPRRGLLSRPSLDEVKQYRRAVDGRMRELIAGIDEGKLTEAAMRIELGLNHEEQHQELLLMDIKHVLAQNPIRPAYQARPASRPVEDTPLRYERFDGGVVEIGSTGDGFCFDNETPRHKTYLEPFELGHRLVRNRDWLEFIADGGYTQAGLWLSDGWAWVNSESIRRPEYWIEEDGGYLEHTLGGTHEIELDAPVVHVSFFEADAFARWAGARLPREAEWEHAVSRAGASGEFMASRRYHPGTEPPGDGLKQMLGDVWEWTQSPYAPYPGFQPLPGALGEYNGKFMCNQMVLRGGACVTPQAHVRVTYRNFFYPHQRWAFSGLRLARDIR